MSKFIMVKLVFEFELWNIISKITKMQYMYSVFR